VSSGRNAPVCRVDAPLGAAWAMDARSGRRSHSLAIVRRVADAQRRERVPKGRRRPSVNLRQRGSWIAVRASGRAAGRWRLWM